MAGAPQNPLVLWAVEREAIRKRKEAGEPPPWTKDKILQTYRFCNVRRRDDRVSQWLIKNVYTPHELFAREYPAAFLLFVALCRWINWPPTIKAIMDAGLWPAQKLDYRAIWKLLDAQAKRGEKVWTGAYMIRAKPGSGRSKAHYVLTEVVERSLEPVKHALPASCAGNMRQAVWELLMSRPNWGSFMAGQVVDDLTWTPLLRHPVDDLHWAPRGPGSVRGANRLRGVSLREPISDELWFVMLQDLRRKVIDALGAEYGDLTAHDVQNMLCETDKYLRVKNGEGRPRAKYAAETAY